MDKEIFIQWFMEKGITREIAEYLFTCINIYERLFNKSPLAQKFPLATCDLAKELQNYKKV